MAERFAVIENIRERLLRPLPGWQAQEVMVGRIVSMPPAVPADARLSAVLCLLFYIDRGLHVLLMQRSADKGAHSGQVSFPGGRHEERDASLLQTALRETDEEVGIGPADVEVLGPLSPLYIPVSNFNVFPFVAFSPARPAYAPSNDEVAAILEVPLRLLYAPETKTTATVYSPVQPELPRKVNAYRLPDGTIIWGATAMILSELEVMLSGIDL